MRLEGKVALVTGSSRGIGRTIALALAREGADLVINYRVESGEARAIVDQIENLGRRARAYQADVTSSEQVEAMVSETLKEFGRIDILVCNAGVGSRATIVETTDEEWDRVFSVNVRGVFNLARAVMPHMMEREYGRIVTISSVIGKTGGGWVSKSNYAASKAAVIGYTKGMALEGGSYGITANAVCPGSIEKEGMGGARPTGFRERALQAIPLGRLGSTEDVAAAVVFLASDEAAYITGCTLDVNGGLLMA